MAATDAVVTFAGFVKFYAPDGDVLLCEGGFLDFNSERYESWHEVFGTISGLGELEASFGDATQDGELVFAPNPDAATTDWWRFDLAGCRVRLWLGEVDADNVTVTTAEQVDDLLVDTIERVQDEGGDRLSLGMMGRAEKLFLINEGNVCSSRFHQTVFAGEEGFDNCTDVRGYVAWGTATPPRSAGGGSIGSGLSTPARETPI